MNNVDFPRFANTLKMTPPLDEEKAQIVQESIEEFVKELDASLTLHHYFQYNDAAKFIEVAQSVHDKAFKSLRKTISKKFTEPQTKLELEDEFKRRVVQTIKEYESERDQNTMERTEAFLKELVRDVSKHFKSRLELQILLAPDMALERVKKLIETGKESAIRHFDDYSSYGYGYVGLFWEQKRELEQELDEIGRERIEHQRSLLSMRSEEESLEKLKQAVMGMLRKVKPDSGSDQQTFSRRILKAKVKGFHASLLRDYGEIYSNSIRIEPEESPEEFIKSAEELTMEPQFVNEKGMETSFLEEIIKQEPLENEYEDHGGETEHDIDIDVKIEGLVVDSSSQKPDHVVKQSHQQSIDEVNAMGSEEEDVRNSEQNEDEPVGATANDGERDVTSISMDTNDVNEDVVVLKQTQQRANDRHAAGASNKRQNVNLSDEEDFRILKRQKPLERLHVAEIPIEPRPSQQLGLISMDTNENGDVLLPQRVNRSKLFNDLQRSSKRLDGVDARKLNVSDETGDFPLLRSIRNGENVECIKEMLEAGAYVNIKRKIRDSNAAHEVITSIIKESRTIDGALTVLNLLKDNGFDLKLLNCVNSEGMTPLYYAMQIKDLDEGLLTWFLENGADANATVVETKDSVLLEAISLGQNPTVLFKLLEYDANPKHVNKWGDGVLHEAATSGNQSAMEIFTALDEVDVNQKNMNGETPLHLVFEHPGLDHEKCLRLLCEKGAKFGEKQWVGLIPSALSEINISDHEKIVCSTLMKTRDILPITEDIASADLTYIVKNMEWVQDFMDSSSLDAPNDFVQFIIFLINEKGAKLQLRLGCENEWRGINWGELMCILTSKSNFVNELRTTCQVTLYGNNLNLIKAGILGRLDLYTDSPKDFAVSVGIETVLASLLACKEYTSVVEVCRLIEKFCVV